MPSFLVYRLGHPTKRVSFDTPPVRVGRDAENDIVIPSETVSREHAVFMQDETRRWFVGCVSETNPIVVSGKLVSTSTPIADMTEVLVGNDCLILFVLNPANAAHLVSARRTQQLVCQTCWWTGMVSVYNKEAACPRCGATTLGPADEMQAEVDANLVGDAGTRVLSQGEIRASYRVMRDAARAVLARTDKHGGRRVLTESESVHVHKKSDELPLKGIVLGNGFTLSWDGRNWNVESHMFWPRLRVNGEAVRTAKIHAGDVLEVGGNRFELRSE